MVMNRDNNNWILWMLIIAAGLYIFTQCKNNNNETLTTDVSSSLPNNMLSDTDPVDLAGGLNSKYSAIDFSGGDAHPDTTTDVQIATKPAAKPAAKVAAEQKVVPSPIEYPQASVDQPEPTIKTETVEAPKEQPTVSGYDASDTSFLLPESTTVDSKERLKPNELLPADSVDVTNQNFLSASLVDNVTKIGKPTQVNRNRKNYDLRSTPVIDKKDISPWNNSTIEPDTERRVFEIGQPECVCP